MATTEEATSKGVMMVILIVIVLTILPSVVAVIPILSIASKTNHHSEEVLLLAPTPPPFHHRQGQDTISLRSLEVSTILSNEQMGVSDPPPLAGPMKNLVDQASLMGALTIAVGTQITAVATIRRDIVPPHLRVHWIKIHYLEYLIPRNPLPQPPQNQ